MERYFVFRSCPINISRPLGRTAVLAITFIWIFFGIGCIEPSIGIDSNPKICPSCTSAVLLDMPEFDQSILHDSLSAMIDFYSPLCHACLSMDSVVEALAQEFSDKTLIGKVNVLTNDSLLRRYSIAYVPAFLFFKNGVEVDRIIGAVPSDSLRLRILQLQN